MRHCAFAVATGLCLASPGVTAATAPDPSPTFDAAAAFGARPSVAHLRLAPDGKTVAYIAPTKGQGSVLYTLALTEGAQPKIALVAAGTPDRIEACNWIANDRLLCLVYAILMRPNPLAITRFVAVNADGSNPQALSSTSNLRTWGTALSGGQIIDWLPEQPGSVLIARAAVRDAHLGSRIGNDENGMHVDAVDTRTLAARTVEANTNRVTRYLGDGRGNVRIMELEDVRGATGYDADSRTYLYRIAGKHDWHTLGKYNFVDGTGFLPIAVDPARDVVYGFKKYDGRKAVYAISLDGSLHEEVVYASDEVDVDHLIRIGRHERVVGVSYATDYRQAVYTDPTIEKVVASLERALKSRPAIVDGSLDENQLLVFTSRDTDPGVYYLFDRQARQLRTFLVQRSELEHVTLATVSPVTYPARDGAQVPGYLTLPPGHESARGLPAIVMPHGGPSARDEWGFNWLVQYYAARGYAVLQPNYRGSSGYGDAWFAHNGFQSWESAISDIIDAGHWLVAQGVDPAKLGIVGWSYGGYAALQSAVVEPSLFRAVVAIAPVTDLTAFKETYRFYTNFRVVEDFVGVGPHVKEGSPIEHADRIKCPVLLVHGKADLNVPYAQSQRMDERLAAAGVKHEFLSFESLDHQLEDSAARAEVLSRSDAFLRAAFAP